ncbi:MAG: hypothetical protein R3A44_38580 [Caldilineaceae bacterium]
MTNQPATKPNLPNPSVEKRVIALFPGAFRPPHQAHLTAVLSLAARPDVTEVVVIISNRSRLLPGTTKVMDAETARRVWEIYLQHVPKARVEIAPHAAVDHALEYFQRVAEGDALLFCIGQSDLASGDDRFARIATLSQQTGIVAEIAPAPTGHLHVRATDLRTMLAQGRAGRADFMAALPATLTAEQRARVWQECVDGLVEMDVITLEKVVPILTRNGPFELADLTIARPGKLDPVLRARTTAGRIIYVKYAGDTVDGDVGQATSRKPRRRLAVEKRALSRLHEHGLATIGPRPVDLPAVLHFDKETRTLVQRAVFPDGWSLQDELAIGRFDVSAADQIATFLANCHRAPAAIRPLWGDEMQDAAHWAHMLALHTAEAPEQMSSPSLRNQLARLREQSQQAQRRGFFHLDLLPQNIRLSPAGQLGVIDFELSATVGDPAYEVGLLLGHYLFWGIYTSAQAACRVAAAQLLDTYRRGVGDTGWSEMQARCAAFAGAAMLEMWHAHAQNRHPWLRSEIPAVGRKLLIFRPNPCEFVWYLGDEIAKRTALTLAEDLVNIAGANERKRCDLGKNLDHEVHEKVTKEHKG